MAFNPQPICSKHVVTHDLSSHELVPTKRPYYHDWINRAHFPVKCDEFYWRSARDGRESSGSDEERWSEFCQIKKIKKMSRINCTDKRFAGSEMELLHCGMIDDFLSTVTRLEDVTRENLPLIKALRLTT